MQATMQRTEQRLGNTAARRSLPPMLQPAPHDALALLEQFGTTVSVHGDRQIHGQGDQADCCYRILSGCVRTVKLMEDGRRQIGEFLMAGDLLDFDALGTYDFAAEAVSDVVLRRYPRRMVDALAESNVALTRRLRDMTSISLRMAHARLVLLGRKTASERIASFLLEMAERLPDGRPNVLDLPMGRTRYRGSSRPDHRDGMPSAGTSAPRRHGGDRRAAASRSATVSRCSRWRRSCGTENNGIGMRHLCRSAGEVAGRSAVAWDGADAAATAASVVASVREDA